MPPFNFLNLVPRVDELMRGRTAPFAPPTPPPTNQPLTPRNPVNLPPTLALAPTAPTTPSGQAELPAMKMTPMSRDFTAALPPAPAKMAVPDIAAAPDVAARPPGSDKIEIPKTYNRFWEGLKSAGMGALMAARESNGNPWAMLGGAATGGVAGLARPGDAYNTLKYEAVTRPYEQREALEQYEQMKRANDIMLGGARTQTEIARQKELGARSEIQRQESLRKEQADKLNAEILRNKDKREQERLQYDKSKPLAMGPNGIYLQESGKVVEGTPKAQRQPTPTEQRALRNDEAEANAVRDAEADPEWGLRAMTPEQRGMLSTGRKMVPQRDGSNQIVTGPDGKPVMMEVPLSPGEQAALQGLLQKAKADEVQRRKQYYQREGIGKQKTTTRIVSDPSISKYKGIIPGF